MFIRYQMHISRAMHGSCAEMLEIRVKTPPKRIFLFLGQLSLTSSLFHFLNIQDGKGCYENSIIYGNVLYILTKLI